MVIVTVHVIDCYYLKQWQSIKSSIAFVGPKFFEKLIRYTVLHINHHLLKTVSCGFKIQSSTPDWVFIPMTWATRLPITYMGTKHQVWNNVLFKMCKVQWIECIICSYDFSVELNWIKVSSWLKVGKNLWQSLQNTVVNVFILWSNTLIHFVLYVLFCLFVKTKVTILSPLLLQNLFSLEKSHMLVAENVSIVYHTRDIWKYLLNATLVYLTKRMSLFQAEKVWVPYGKVIVERKSSKLFVSLCLDKAFVATYSNVSTLCT